MGARIKYKLRNLSASDFEGLDSKIRKIAAGELSLKVNGVTCPDHGQRAEVAEVRETEKGLSIEISGCCDGLINRAQKAISE